MALWHEAISRHLQPVAGDDRRSVVLPAIRLPETVFDLIAKVLADLLRRGRGEIYAHKTKLLHDFRGKNPFMAIEPFRIHAHSFSNRVCAK
ncbi:hypothetical protein CXB49_10725 [Chromobacterium sp. ATCC 53434]|nr:hypothetical protein CXB49_10725 [Chromobacterium sp. ATCC 53434]